MLVWANLSAGSILSSFGLGEPAVTMNTRSMGMGFISVSQDNPYYINMTNPAALYRMQYTMLYIQYLYSGNNATDLNADHTSHYSNINQFAFALPLSSKFGFSAQFSPKTRVDYTLGFKSVNDGYDYTESVAGTGGLNTFNISAYFSPLPFISIGVSNYYSFGRIDETWSVDYENSEFSNTEDLFLSRNNGYGFRFGLLVRPVKTVSVGAVYSTAVTLNTDTDTSYRFEYDKYTYASHHVLPSWFKGGISVTLFKKMIFSAEYGLTKWTELKINDLLAENTHDSQSIGVGIEYLPTSKPTDGYLKKISYRAGFCSKPYLFTSANGNTIQETWLTCGLGLPLFGGSKIDVALNFGTRGDLEANGLSEKFIRLGLAVTTGEKWFMRRY